MDTSNTQQIPYEANDDGRAYGEAAEDHGQEGVEFLTKGLACHNVADKRVYHAYGDCRYHGKQGTLDIHVKCSVISFVWCRSV